VALVELRLVEQRYRAVCEVLDGATVTDVALRNGVVRQTVHDWLRRYAADGIAGLADRTSKPATCPHQMSPALEVRVVELRRAHPSWGPRRIGHQLSLDGVDPPPGRSSVYRTLVRHRLIDPTKRKRSKSDYKRWERSHSMELWQMDVVGRIYLRDGTQLHAITGIDDHSRFCVSARLVERATARPVCDALLYAMRIHGVPNQILTDNGKVFTARFGKGPGPVLFDRICAQNGIRHLLTAPYSPTTTGKVERFHRTLRAEFLKENDYRFATIEEAQEALDQWVVEYNTIRPHQSIGMRPPVERFSLADRSVGVTELDPEQDSPPPVSSDARAPGVNRWVDQRGKISLGRFRYHVGPVFAGEAVDVVVRDGLVQILHQGVLVATHAERRRDSGSTRTNPIQRTRAPRVATVGDSVARRVDNGGSISFAGSAYRVGRSWRQTTVLVAIVAGSVQISAGGKVIRVHAIRHDRSKEHGAFAQPRGKPRKAKSA
jgi:transposase InsO family protein